MAKIRRRTTNQAPAPEADPMQGLRKRAEALGNQRAGELQDNPELLTPEAARRTLHELRVHQIELEMQNEELRRVQTELEESRARYFDLYDLAPVGYLTLNEEGLILEANLTAAKLLGVPRGDLVKQPLSRFILPEDQDSHYRHRKQLLETGAPQSWELRLLRKDSEPFWARVEATIAQNADGASVWRAVVSDITENKRAERLIQAHSDELHEFAYALTHDVQEPLGTILNLTQRLAQDYKGRLGETTDKYLAHCVESARRIEVLLKGLLDYLDYRARRQSLGSD
jgi:PAS domain S-box-containing protein